MAVSNWCSISKCRARVANAVRYVFIRLLIKRDTRIDARIAGKIGEKRFVRMEKQLDTITNYILGNVKPPEKVTSVK